MGATRRICCVAGSGSTEVRDWRSLWNILPPAMVRGCPKPHRTGPSGRDFCPPPDVIRVVPAVPQEDNSCPPPPGTSHAVASDAEEGSLHLLSLCL